MENSHFYWVSITGQLRMNKRDRNNADENKGWENQGSRIEKNKDKKGKDFCFFTSVLCRPRLTIRRYGIVTQGSYHLVDSRDAGARRVI